MMHLYKNRSTLPLAFVMMLLTWWRYSSQFLLVENIKSLVFGWREAISGTNWPISKAELLICHHIPCGGFDLLDIPVKIMLVHYIDNITLIGQFRRKLWEYSISYKIYMCHSVGDKHYIGLGTCCTGQIYNFRSLIISSFLGLSL